ISTTPNLTPGVKRVIDECAETESIPKKPTGERVDAHANLALNAPDNSDPDNELFIYKLKKCVRNSNINSLRPSSTITSEQVASNASTTENPSNRPSIAVIDLESNSTIPLTVCNQPAEPVTNKTMPNQSNNSKGPQASSSTIGHSPLSVDPNLFAAGPSHAITNKAIPNRSTNSKGPHASSSTIGHSP